MILPQWHFQVLQSERRKELGSSLEKRAQDIRVSKDRGIVEERELYLEFPDTRRTPSSQSVDESL